MPLSQEEKEQKKIESKKKRQEYMKNYYKTHQDTIIDQANKYYENNKETILKGKKEHKIPKKRGRPRKVNVESSS